MGGLEGYIKRLQVFEHDCPYLQCLGNQHLSGFCYIASSNPLASEITYQSKKENPCYYHV